MRANPLGDQFANGIIDHGAGDAGVQPETIGQIGRDIKFAAADVDVAMGCFAEGNDAGIKPMDERAEGQESRLLL